MSIENGEWAANIGDPTIIGWLTVVTYFCVAIICFKSYLSTKNNFSLNTNNKSNKNFWLFLTFFLVALAINKQLDLQTLFTQIGKSIAIEQGWYENRRLVQLGFIILIGLIGITSTALLLKTYKNSMSAIKIALTGCIILFAFVLIRASSFHHMDMFINMKIIGIKMNWLLELGGLTIIGIGSLQYYKSNNANTS